MRFRFGSTRQEGPPGPDGTRAPGDPPANQPDGSAGESYGKVPYLFVQSFGSGSITPMDGAAGRYTVTLEHGLGQTLYFADRPSRDVGATPTPEFLAGLGFDDDDPPNAALVVDGPDGPSIATVELFHPLYDPVSPGVTYELREIDDAVPLDDAVATTPLAELRAAFGAAHLFIDDCADTEVTCFSTDSYGTHSVYRGSLGTQGTCWYWGEASCITCGSGGLRGAVTYWSTQCNNAFGACGGECRANQVCRSGLCWAPSPGA